MLISPSILSADFSALREDIIKCDRASPYSYHVDVMDGHFVNNITIGPGFTKALRSCTETPLECHLMIDRPDRYYGEFVKAGADILLCHVESPVSTGSLFKKFMDEGIPYGVVINPETSLDRALPFLEGSSILLIMSVHPGFSGQKFIPEALDKVKAAREYIDSNSLNVKIEIDGGINDSTGKLARDAGADILVSGSYIFGGNIEERAKLLKSL